MGVGKKRHWSAWGRDNDAAEHTRTGQRVDECRGRGRWNNAQRGIEE